ncbi:MAG: hypothetical protein IPM55_17745 [Acidobacteria bacterium]|nr:hypothetical protein [Acidobacteriota bacterium]
MSDSPLRIVPKQPIDPEAPGDQTEVSTPDADTPDPKAELAELRRLLIEPEQTKIDNILERLNNPRVRAREISRTLPGSDSHPRGTGRCDH